MSESQEAAARLIELRAEELVTIARDAGLNAISYLLDQLMLEATRIQGRRPKGR